MKEKILKHKKLSIFLAVLLIVAIIAGVAVSRARAAAERMMEAMNQTQTAYIERRTLVSSVSATGTVASSDSKDVAVNLSGVEVLSVSVEVGDQVEVGDVLCEFDSEDIEEELANAKASLNVSSAKTQMDITSAERSLAEAETTRNIELERADTDVADAWNDYMLALNDQEEAENDWEEAKHTTAEKEGEYELRQKQLADAQEKLNAAGSSASYSTQFIEQRDKLQDLVSDSQNGITTGTGAMDKVGLGNDLSIITVGDGSTYDFQTSDSTIQGDIISLLESLKGLQASYNNSLALESSLSSLQQEVASWQTKVNTAKQSEASAESAYEQAVSAAQSKLDAYTSKVRAKEDTQRNQDSTVQSKTDSLATSKLNATTSTLSDEQKVEQYEEQLEDCIVKAPISGVVTAVNVKAGDTYSGAVIVTIEDNSSYEVAAEIDEYDIGKIAKGQKVVIKTNGTGDEELEGTVQQIAPRATAESSDVTYNVRISIDTPNDMLRLDMTAKLSIILESKDNVLTVPYEAVMEDESGNYYIEVVKTDDLDLSQTQEQRNWAPNAGSAEDNNLQQTGENQEQENTVSGNEAATTRKPEANEGREMSEGEMNIPEGGEIPEAGKISEGGEIPEAGKIPEGGEMPEAGKISEGGEIPEAGEMSEGREIPEAGKNIPEDGEIPEAGKISENEEMPDNVSRDNIPAQDRISNNGENNNSESEIQTIRIIVEKGIESDYYIEVISDQIKEGMQVVVPRTEDDGMDIQGMMMRQGPMGGF